MRECLPRPIFLILNKNRLILNLDLLGESLGGNLGRVLIMYNLKMNLF